MASQLPNINRRAGVTKEQIFLFGNQIFLYGECADVDTMNRVLAADTSAAAWSDQCDNALMKSKSDTASDKFSPLLHVYDMDVLNGADDACSGDPGRSTRRDVGPVARLQERARAADRLGWSAARGWSADPEGVGQASPWLDLAVGNRTTTTVVTHADGSVVRTTTTAAPAAGL